MFFKRKRNGWVCLLGVWHIWGLPHQKEFPGIDRWLLKAPYGVFFHSLFFLTVKSHLLKLQSLFQPQKYVFELTSTWSYSFAYGDWGLYLENVWLDTSLQVAKAHLTFVCISEFSWSFSGFFGFYFWDSDSIKLKHTKIEAPNDTISLQTMILKCCRHFSSFFRFVNLSDAFDFFFWGVFVFVFGFCVS